MAQFDPSANLLATLRANGRKASPAPPSNRATPSYPFTFEAANSASSSPAPPLKSPGPEVPSKATMGKQDHAGTQSHPNLLGLLKFGQPNAGSEPPQVTQPPSSLASHPPYANLATPNVHGRGISASDLVSSIMGQTDSKPPTPRAPASSSSTHQDSLLRLLNRNVSGTDTTHKNRDSSPQTLSHDLARASIEGTESPRPSISPSRQKSPIRYFGEATATSPFDPQDVPKASPSHQAGSYVNPFEDQAASSPLSMKPRRLTANGGTSKRIKSQSPAATQNSTRRKLTPSGNDVLHSIDPPIRDAPKDERTPVEALMGIGAPSRDAETVAAALNEVGEKVDRQVENALAAAERKEKTVHVKQEEEDDVGSKVQIDAIQEHVHDAAVGLKKELEKEENKNALNEVMPDAAAKALKDVIDEAANDDTRDEGQARQIKVHQFPMRPFVSIELVQKDQPELLVREDSTTPIARFKKEFDQADRTLASATNEFIAYAIHKSNGGVRVIGQEDGQSNHLFADSRDRVFHVALSTTVGDPNGLQRVIATGVSGTVYCATIQEPGAVLSEEEMQLSTVIIPAFQTGTDTTSGGQLKTRAKRSSRHPQFFAIGRGKAIYVVFPSHARNSEFMDKKTMMVDADKYLAERSLKITTGKAGKDFTFSEDDSIIVTLDKAGKLRLWDVRELVDQANEDVSRLAPIEIKTPILSFATAHASEKSWPTSVLFVDKIKPYNKGTALRYMLLGMKQNHTLQLWDLCLGKAVQELSFPHEKETDAICSVDYHPGSGIIVVGHPTRNSVYFIHLSAPKYNLPSMSQAKFAQRLANKDSSLPKAEATAIMSGMREYSLADKGQLRSIELTPSSGEVTRLAEDEEDPMLFELYIVHSKGLTGLSVKKQDLGLSRESRVLCPVDAEAEGVIVVKDIRETMSNPASEPSTISVNGAIQAPMTPAKAPAKSPSKEKEKTEHTEEAAPSRDAEKKKNKKAASAASDVNATPKAVVSTPQVSSSALKGVAHSGTPKDTSKDTSEPLKSSAEERGSATGSRDETVSVGIDGAFLDKELKRIEKGVSLEFNKVISKELDVLYKHFAEDKRIQEAAGAAKQDAMLRLVSSTLGDNVEKALSRIILTSIKDTVLPSIADVATNVLKQQLPSVIAQQTQLAIPSAVKQTLPEAVSRAMQGPDMIRTVTEQMSKTMSVHVEREMSKAMQNTILPSYHDLASTVAQKMKTDTDGHMRQQLMQAESSRQLDSKKIDQLTTLVSSLSDTVHTMASSQSQFQEEILKLQQKVKENELQIAAARSQAANTHSPTPSESASHHQISPEEQELEAVTAAMNEGRYEEATVMV